MTDLEPNYYQEQQQQDSLHYRLDAGNLIEQSIDTFKGGIKEKVNGKKIYYEKQRLMNDLGISRARMILEAGVNKINHLTKYKDEERVFKQLKGMVRAWVYEVTLNMKKWSPNATFDGVTGKLINPYNDKIRNKHLVITVVENALLQSMLRGTAGFEAELTGKQMVVTENKDYSTQTRQQDNNLNGWFGGGQ